MEIVDKLREIENHLVVFNAFVNDKANSEDDRKVVSFKMLYDMMAFTSLIEFAEDYVPKASTEFLLAQHLKGVVKFVSVTENKVVISPEYYTLLQQRDELLKNKK